MPRNSQVVAISHLSPKIIAAGKAKAKSLHMSFSGYVVSLIERDIKSGGKGLNFSAPPEVKPLHKKRKTKPQLHHHGPNSNPLPDQPNQP